MIQSIFQPGSSCIHSVLFGVSYYQVRVVPDDGSGASSDRAAEAVGFQHKAWAVLSVLQYKAVSD